MAEVRKTAPNLENTSGLLTASAKYRMLELAQDVFCSHLKVARDPRRSMVPKFAKLLQAELQGGRRKP